MLSYHVLGRSMLFVVLFGLLFMAGAFVPQYYTYIYICVYGEFVLAFL